MICGKKKRKRGGRADIFRKRRKEIQDRYNQFEEMIRGTGDYKENRRLEENRMLQEEESKIMSVLHDFRSLDMTYVSKERPRTFGFNLLPPEDERLQVRQKAIDNLVELLTGPSCNHHTRKNYRRILFTGLIQTVHYTHREEKGLRY